MPLTLKPAKTARHSGTWSDDDYDVLEESRTSVGRIMKSEHAPRDAPWFWSIDFHQRRPGPKAHQGNAADRQAAMAAFRAAWDAQN